MDALARRPMSAAEIRRLPAVGRGARFDLHRVPGVVLVDVLDHGCPDVAMPAGTTVVHVWLAAGSETAAEAMRAVVTAAPAGALVIPVVQVAGWQEHALAWLLRQRWRLRRWAWERRQRKAGRAR